MCLRVTTFEGSIDGKYSHLITTCMHLSFLELIIFILLINVCYLKIINLKNRMNFKVAAIALISSSRDISMGNPCELKEALDLISLNYAPFCKYNATIEESDKLFDWGIAAFCGHSILFLVILSACMWPAENKKIGFLIINIVVSIVLESIKYLNATKYLWFNTRQVDRTRSQTDKKNPTKSGR